MVDKKAGGLNATKLRMILFVSMALILIAGGVAFWFMRVMLVDFANEVRNTTLESATTSNDIVKLEGLKKVLDNEKDDVERAGDILADTESYIYQERIIDDLNKYSKLAGVKIVSITFNSTGSDAGGSSTAPVAETPPTEGEPAGGEMTGGEAGFEGESIDAPVAATPLSTVSITVNLTTPAKYENVMQFLRYIEYNTPKMQVRGVSLTNSSSGTDKLQLLVPSFDIEVYTK